MKTPMRTLLVTMAAVGAFASCKSAEVRPEPNAPTVPEQELKVVTQSLTDCTIKLDAQVSSDEEAVVEKAVYEFVVDGTVLKAGEVPVNVTIPAAGKAPVAVQESFTYVKDGEALKAMDARGGSLLLALRGTLHGHLNIPASENSPASTVPFEVEFARSREVRTPRLPHVKLVDYEAFAEAAASEVRVLFHVGVVNPNPFEVSLSGITYEAQLAGKKVGDGTLGKSERVSAASTGVFDISVSVTEETHGKDVKKLIKGLIIPYVLTGEMTTAMYNEPLDAKGDVKLNVSKEK